MTLYFPGFPPTYQIASLKSSCVFFSVWPLDIGVLKGLFTFLTQHLFSQMTANIRLFSDYYHLFVQQIYIEIEKIAGKMNTFES